MLETIRKLNPDIEIYNVNDKDFRAFGRVITNINSDEIIKEAEKCKMPISGSMYIPGEPSFEKLSIHKTIENEVFGEIPIQTGLCFGFNNYLNAAEWHLTSEVNIAVTDLILFLAKRENLNDNKISSDEFRAFFVPKGTIVEIFSSSLHFCPCQVSKDGFKCIVILPKDTNTPLENNCNNKLLFRKNKWIISHFENKDLISGGAVSGIYGKNLRINY